MNLLACPALVLGPENQVWYRAVQPQFLATALQSSHTKHFPSRFSEGPTAVRPFEVLYLAEDQQVALFEVQALLGSPLTPPGGGLVVPNPRQAWVALNVRVTLQRVADLTRVPEQTALGTTVQELTGDWQG
jgi:hypothetical protein